MGASNSCKRLRSEVRTFLVGLGSGPGEVAGRLQSEGVRGVRKSADNCAIARYVSAVLASDVDIASVRVAWEHLVVTVVRHRHRHRRKVIVRLPQPVKEFVRLFDGGDFPELLILRDPGQPKSEVNLSM